MPSCNKISCSCARSAFEEKGLDLLCRLVLFVISDKLVGLIEKKFKVDIDLQNWKRLNQNDKNKLVLKALLKQSGQFFYFVDDRSIEVFNKDDQGELQASMSTGTRGGGVNFDSWYEGWLAKYRTVYIPSNNEINIKYYSSDYKNEFVEKVFNYTNIKKDSINFIENNYKKSQIKAIYNTKEEIEETFKMLTLPNSSEIIKHFTDGESNLAYIRIQMNSGENYVYTIVINRWHKNVALLFNEESRLDPTKDRINFIKGFVGSYPNVFVSVKQDDLNEFFNIMQNYKNNEKDNKTLSKFAINRANPEFWEIFDWFDKEFKKQDPLYYGLFDLNRYISNAENK